MQIPPDKRCHLKDNVGRSQDQEKDNMGSD